MGKFIKQQSTDDKLKQLFESSPDVFDGTMVRARHILMTPGTDEAKQKEAAGKLRIKQVVEQETAKAVAALPATADALQKEQTKATKTEELFALREGALGLPVEEGRRRSELLPARRRWSSRSRRRPLLSSPMR